MATSQCVVMEEHSSLKLEPFLEERNMLHLPLGPDQALAVRRNGWHFVNIPDVRRLLEVLIAVDLLLLISPIWERRGMSPHGDFAWIVHELELSRQAL